MQADPSYHITGNHPVREIEPSPDDGAPQFVRIPCGFETLDIAVYGDGLSSSDAIESAFEFLKRRSPDWTDDWGRYEESAFVTLT